jgi:hypothetical protein
MNMFSDSRISKLEENQGAAVTEIRHRIGYFAKDGEGIDLPLGTIRCGRRQAGQLMSIMSSDEYHKGKRS